ITLRPDLIQASHGPTPAALTRTKTSPSPGIGRGTSSTTSESMPPKLCTRIACMMHLDRHHTRDVESGPLDHGVAAISTDASTHTNVQWTTRITKRILFCEAQYLWPQALVTSGLRSPWAQCPLSGCWSARPLAHFLECRITR